VAVQSWVFVTGAPRSGTTFVGSMLSTPLTVDYIHEPFNHQSGLPEMTRPFPSVEEGSPDEQRLRHLVERMKAFDLSLRSPRFPTDSRARAALKRVLASRGPRYLLLARLNPWHRAVVVKDPMGCLLTGYLTSVHGFRAVVLVRHPLGVVNSYRRLGWSARDQLQSVAADERLERLPPELAELVRRPGHDELAAGALLWRTLNTLLAAQVEGNDRATVVRHEDLSADPARRFPDLFAFAGVPWTRLVQWRVARLTAGGNPVEVAGRRPHAFRRASAELHAASVVRFSPEERRRVFELTWPAARAHYDEASFAL
jgi:hypothetical protein